VGRTKPIGALLALLVSLTASADAGAVTIVEANRPSIASRHQLWADSARVSTPRVVVRLHRSSCPGRPEPACVIGTDVWLSPAAGSAGLARSLFLHELGHVFDGRMPEWARTDFRRLIRDRRPWRSAPNSPHEQFAVAYELCAEGERVERGMQYGYGYSPRPAAHRAACRLIRRVARRDRGRFETSWPTAREAVVDLNG